MIDLQACESDMPIAPPGIDENYLIDPEHLVARQWGLCCISDRLTFRQIRILIGSGHAPNLYGLFGIGSARRTVRLDATADAVSEFFVAMVGGDVCVFDMPNSFLISVLEGDLTLVATTPANLQNICGKTGMSRSDWIEIAKDLRSDISARILSKYSEAAGGTQAIETDAARDFATRALRANH
jgi:hypothetical protein